MSSKIQPSQFYYVKDNVTFKSCLALMKEKGLSFLLIENRMGKLTGIFTLKDLLKHYAAIGTTTGLEKTIRHYMTKPVLTIPAHRIHKATQIMTEEGIRHLPITSDRTGEESRILGVVDMESLLAHDLIEEKRKKYQAKEISVYSPNGSLLRLMKNVLKKYDLIQVDKMWYSKLRTDSHYEAHAHDYDIFFFDLIEDRDLRMAIKFAPFVNKARKRMICLVSPETFKGSQPRADLDRLAKLSRVKVFHKPTEVHDLIFECLS